MSTTTAQPFYAQPQFKFLRKNSGGAWDTIKIEDAISPTYNISSFNFELFKIGGCGATSFTSSRETVGSVYSETAQEYRDSKLTYNDEIQIRFGPRGSSADDSLLYTGYITRIPKEGTQKDFSYEALGYYNQLQWRIVESFEVTDEGETLDHAVKRLLTTEIAPNTEVSSDTSLIQIPLVIDGWDTEINDMLFEFKTTQDIMEVFQQIAGYFEWGVDENKKLYFRSKNPTPATTEELQHFWRVGRQGVIDFIPQENSDRIANKIYIDCGTMSDGKNHYMIVSDSNSISRYGQRESQVSLPDAFPQYNTDFDLFRGKTEGYGKFNAGIRTSGFGTGANRTDIGVDNMCDGNPFTAWKSGQEQKGGVRFWTKMNNDDAILDPGNHGGKGSGGSIIGEATTYAQGKFGNGLQIEASEELGSVYAGMETDTNDFANRVGAVGMWWKPQYNFSDRDLLYRDIPPELVSLYPADYEYLFIWGVRKTGRLGQFMGGVAYVYKVSGDVDTLTGLTIGQGKFAIITNDDPTLWKFQESPMEFDAGDNIHFGLTWHWQGFIPVGSPGGATAYIALWVYREGYSPTVEEGPKEAPTSARTPNAGYPDKLRGVSKWTDDRLAIGASPRLGAFPALGVCDNFKYYPLLKTNWMEIDEETGFSNRNSEAADNADQQVEIELQYQRNIGNVVVNSESRDESDHGAKGLRVEAYRIPVTGDAYWETVYEKFSGVDTNLSVRMSPNIPTKKIRLTCLGHTTTTEGEDPNGWNIYSVNAYEFASQTVDAWGQAELDKTKDPEESATFSILVPNERVIPRGKAKVTAANSAQYEYEITKVTYNSGGNQLDIELGEPPDSIATIIKKINRDLLIEEYSTATDKKNYSSGDAIIVGSLPSSAIEEISANKIIAGTIRSINYTEGTAVTSAGMKINLNEGKIIVWESDGLQIESAGGINIGVNGVFRGGMTDYLTGTGFWLGNDSGTYKLSIGVTGGNYLAFDGSNLTLSGTIVANAGSIGGWILSATTLVGGSTILNSNGTITCANLVAATAGNISGWEISSTTLQKLTGTIGIVLDSANTVVKIGDMSATYIEIDGANEHIGTSDFQQGLSGWQVSSGGNAEFNDITARGSLSATIFKKTEVSAIGGTLFVADTGKLAFPMIVGETTMLTEGEIGLVVNDIVKLQKEYAGVPVEEWMKVTAVDNTVTPPEYTVERDMKGVGERDWPAGSVIIQYGNTSGGGIIYMSSESDADATPPYIAIKSTAGSPWSDLTAQVIIGNLEGLIWDGSPIAADTWGIYTQTGYFKGTIQADAGYFGAGQKVSIDTNGVVVGDGGNITIEDGGDINFVGTYKTYKIDSADFTFYSVFQIYPTVTADTTLYFGSSEDLTYYANLAFIVGESAAVLESYDFSGAVWRLMVFNGTHLRSNASGVISLGANTYKFKDFHLSGTAYIDTEVQVGGGYGSTGATIYSTGNLSMNGNLVVDGTSTLTGTVSVGVDDTTKGTINVYGGNVTAGGIIFLYMGASSDTTYEYWAINVGGENFLIGPQGDPDIVVILPATGTLKTTVGKIDAFDGFADNGAAGIDWGPADPATISSMTVSGGIITAIS